MTVRRLRVLIDGLPSNSRYKARLRGITDGQRWGDAEYLLAFIADMLQAQYGVQYVGVTHKKPPQMNPYPRPELEDCEAPEAAQANARAEEYLELLSSGALAGQRTSSSGWVEGAVGSIPTGKEQLPRTGDAATN
ncbi:MULTISPECIES: hypothetical protein [unclassified Streptomyces]|uniref:hypothetical protein n=1 Tax=unclassified Streptomyces TaxID=2593676 RepID=UPI0036FAB4A5